MPWSGSEICSCPGPESPPPALLACTCSSHPTALLIQLSGGRPHSPSPSIFDKRIGKLPSRCLRSHSAPGPCGPSTPPSLIPPDSSWILLALHRCLLLTKYPGDAKKQQDMFFTGAGRAGGRPRRPKMSVPELMLPALGLILPIWSWSSPRSPLGPSQDPWELARGSV